MIDSRHSNNYDRMRKGNCSRDERSRTRKKRSLTVGGRIGRSWRHTTTEVVCLLPSRHVRQVQTLRTTTGPRAGTLERWVSSGAWLLSWRLSRGNLTCFFVDVSCGMSEEFTGSPPRRNCSRSIALVVVLLGTKPRSATWELTSRPAACLLPTAFLWPSTDGALESQGACEVPPNAFYIVANWAFKNSFVPSSA